MTKPFLETLRGVKQTTPPVWLMRQAGRYLPEYRELRARAGDFKAMVYTPAHATEATLQPIRRYGFDAAILFSDILTIPEALGQTVQFEQGHGPSLRPLENVSALNPDLSRMEPVYEAVSSIRARLDQEGFRATSLIGFAGAPWTVACYMVDGGGSKEFPKTRTMAHARPDEFAALIGLLTETTTAYLLRQIEAGAEAVQIFDSWAGVLPEDQFRRWVIAPTKDIVAAIKLKYPQIPVIGFPRQAGELYRDYIAETGVDAVSLDTGLKLSWVAAELQPRCIVQGNLDPFVLMAGGSALDQAAGHILETLGDHPFIFNLGHGIHKDTPPEHVARLVDLIRGSSDAKVRHA